MTIYKVFKKNALEYSDAYACEYFGKKLTYRELLRKTDDISAKLVTIGVKKGSAVAINMVNSPMLLALLLAVNKLGGKAVMLSPKSPGAELEKQLAMTDADVLIFANVCEKNVYDAMNEWGKDKHIKLIRVNVLEGLSIKYKLACSKKVLEDVTDYNRNSISVNRIKYTKDEITIATDDNADAIVIFSSGTGGEHKAIVHSSKGILIAVEACEKLISPIPEGFRMLSVLPACHIFGIVITILAPLMLGGCVVCVPFYDVKYIIKLLCKKCPEYMAAVPTIIRHICENELLKRYQAKGCADMKNLRMCVCGGDNLPKHCSDAFNEIIRSNGGNGYIAQGYGMSECCPIAVCDKENEEYCVGNTITGCEIKIYDEEGKEVLEGEMGEVRLYSSYLMKGYYYGDKIFHKPCTDNLGREYIDTGDIGYLKDGKLYFVCRKRRIIKVSGNSIFAGYVEDAIKSHPYVKECVVVPVKHKTKGNTTFAFVVSKCACDENILRSEILEVCKKQLIPYAIPTGIEFCVCNDIKMTLLGKVAYGFLEKRAIENMCE